MSQALDYLLTRWPALALLGGAAVLAVVLLWRRRGSAALLLTAAAMTLAAVGGLALPSRTAGAWTAALALAALLLMLAALVLFGRWWAPLGYAVGVALLVGLGGWLTIPLGAALVGAGRFLVSLRPAQPWWLLLLLLVPLLVALSFRSLAGLGPVRRWVALGLRCSLIVLVILAVAETEARGHNEGLTVFYLLDRSFSMPPGDGALDYVNEAWARRGPGHERDRVGVIVFGRQPRLELLPAAVPRLRLRKIVSPVDESYTDIAAAIKLALASFPEGTAKRIVLVSDGNQNLGNAEEQARIARQNGVQIDVVPVSAGRLRQQEVLVERVEAPPVTEKDTRLPIRIVLRSYHPQIVVGNLTLIKTTMDLRRVGKGGDGGALFEDREVARKQVRLRQGLNTFFFTEPGTAAEESCTYEAKLVPLWVENARGDKVQDGLPGDRPENNRASANVIARGQRYVLLVEPNVGDHQLLVDRLRKARSSLKVVQVTPGRLPRDPDQLALILSKFDCVILANVPAEALDEAQQVVLRSNTHDQGCGLVMVGGPQGFGAGGWQGTEVEKALPVTCDLKSIKVEGKNGLVLIMHASEMADGNMWQKKIAQLAIKKLSQADMVGVIHYDGAHTWHVPFQQIGQRRAQILGLLDSMVPGDMPDAEPPLTMAYTALSNKKYQLGARHIIFISDGDHWEPPGQIKVLPRLRKAQITLTTVCITTHGAAEVEKMKKLARLVGDVGKRKSSAYHVTNPNLLPEIYIKETRLVSQSFVYDKRFEPILSPRGGPVEGLKPADVKPLHGFVRTTLRPSALVEAPIRTPKLDGYTFPLLAYWHYGLGKAVAFTSDALTHEGDPVLHWDREWAFSEMYGRFWEQVVDWSLRALESGKHLTISTEQRDGKVRVIVEARDADGGPLVNVDLRAGITSPAAADAAPPELRFEQKNSGVYEAEFKAEDAGAYFIHVTARWKDKDGKEVGDSVRAGVTIPYSPEFAEMESNTDLLDRLRALTEGAESEGRSPQPIWPWLLALAGVGLFFDVAVRRITLEPARVVAAARALWARLRGRAAEARPAEFLDRLRSRKAQVGEALDRGRAGRRFEGEPPSASPPAAEGVPPPPPPRPAAPPAAAPAPEEQGDYASRLMRAKKRVWKDRDKE
jgi:uncharacterized membrane protein